MRTNLEKWNHYLKIINEKEQQFIKENINNIPENIYEPFSDGEIKTLNVVKIRYFNNLYYSNKPTKNDVIKIKQYAENTPKLDINNIFVNWEYMERGGKIYSSVRYTELNMKYYIDKELAKLKANKLLEIKRKETELLKNGYIKCTFCGKIVPDKESVDFEIIFQNSKPDVFSKSGYKKFVDRKTNKYCSNKCGGYDQMAHEG